MRASHILFVALSIFVILAIHVLPNPSTVPELPLRRAMSADHSTSTPSPGAQILETVQVTTSAESPTAPSSSVDMLALGFGILSVDSSEDKTSKGLSKVSVCSLVCGSQIQVVYHKI